MQTDKKYEQWKAITESDFVTLFIKTWFAFIAVLRELNPDVDVFTPDGMPRGDKPFLNAYKEGIMPFVQKNINTEDFAQELFTMYPISMQKVMAVFCSIFFRLFFKSIVNSPMRRRLLIWIRMEILRKDIKRVYILLINTF